MSSRRVTPLIKWASILGKGARVPDVVNLKPGNINIGKREVIIKCGKGGIDRNLSFSDYTGELLKKYKEIRQKGEYFFCTLGGNKLDRVYLYSMIRRYANKAVINKNISPHTLRHAYATEYYRQTKDIETLRRILGHSDISTTTIYITLANIDVENGMKSFKGFL